MDDLPHHSIQLFHVLIDNGECLGTGIHTQVNADFIGLGLRSQLYRNLFNAHVGYNQQDTGKRAKNPGFPVQYIGGYNVAIAAVQAGRKSVVLPDLLVGVFFPAF